MKQRSRFGSHLLLLAGFGGVVGCSSNARFVRQINEEYCLPLDDDYGDIRDRHFEELRASGEAGRHALLEVASSDGPNRGCALAYLCAFQDSRALSLSVEILSDGHASADVLMNALGCLGSTRDPRFLDAIRPYLRSPVSSVAQFAVGAVASIGDERARAVLRDLLVRPEHDHFQHIVLRALAQLKDREAVPLILTQDESPETNDLVRYEIVAALGAIDAIGTFTEALDIVRRINTKATRVAALESVWRGLQEQLASLPDGPSEERAAIEKAIEEVKRQHREQR